MAAPLGRADGILAHYLGIHLDRSFPWQYDPPKKCHGRECSPLGRVVMWAAKYVEYSECEIESSKSRRPSSDKEEEDFRSAVDRLLRGRIKVTGLSESIKLLDDDLRGHNPTGTFEDLVPFNVDRLRAFWLEARAYKQSHGVRGVRPGEGAHRNAMRLALVYILLRDSGITDVEACGAVALAEDLYWETWGDGSGKSRRGKPGKTALTHSKQMARELSANPELQSVLEKLSAAAGGEAMGISPDDVLQEPWWSGDEIAHTARELLACTDNLRAVEGLAREAVKEARVLHEGPGKHNFKVKFKMACVKLGLQTKKEVEPGLHREERLARLIRTLWETHRNTVEDMVASRAPDA